MSTDLEQRVRDLAADLARKEDQVRRLRREYRELLSSTSRLGYRVEPGATLILRDVIVGFVHVARGANLVFEQGSRAAHLEEDPLSAD